MATLHTCPCIHCSGKIEFEADRVRESVTCPHCGLETILFAPVRLAPMIKKFKLHPLALAAAIIIIIVILGSVLIGRINPSPKDWEALGEVVATLIVGCSILLIYFLPAVVGRKKANSKAIFVLNFFLGWTFIGWVVALVWACTKEA